MCADGLPCSTELDAEKRLALQEEKQELEHTVARGAKTQSEVGGTQGCQGGEGKAARGVRREVWGVRRKAGGDERCLVGVVHLGLVLYT